MVWIKFSRTCACVLVFGQSMTTCNSLPVKTEMFFNLRTGKCKVQIGITASFNTVTLSGFNNDSTDAVFIFNNIRLNSIV